MNIQIPNLFKKLLNKTHLDFAKVMTGTMTRNLVRGFLQVLLWRYLAPNALGVFRSIFDFFKIMASIADFGLDYAMVTYVSSALGKNVQEEKNEILKSVLVMKIITMMVFIGIGNLLAPWIAGNVFSDLTLVIYVRLVFLAAGGQLLWKYVSNYFAAHQQFTKTAMLLSTTPMLMLAVSGLLILFDNFNLHTIILVYLFSPAVLAFTWWLAMDKDFLVSSSWNKTLVKKLFKFSKWVYFSNGVSTTRNHVNTLLLKNSAISGSVSVGEYQAGIFSAGNSLAAEITIFSESILTVLLPKATSKQTPKDIKKFLEKSYNYLGLLLGPLFALMLLARPFILLLGTLWNESFLQYLPSIEVFYILYVSALFSIASLPLRTALYALRMPHVETVIEVFMLVILVGGGLFFIPKYGAMGAAIVVFMQRYISFIALIVYGIKKLNTVNEKK